MFNRGLSSSGGWTNRLEDTHAMASLGAQMVKNPPLMRETWVQFLDSEDPLEKRMATHSSILPGESPWTEEPGGLRPMGLQSRVQPFATLWTAARQAPLSMGFSRQEYWSGLPFHSPGDLPNPGIETGSPTLQADSTI